MPISDKDRTSNNNIGGVMPNEIERRRTTVCNTPNENPAAFDTTPERVIPLLRTPTRRISPNTRFCYACELVDGVGRVYAFSTYYNRRAWRARPGRGVRYNVPSTQAGCLRQSILSGDPGALARLDPVDQVNESGTGNAPPPIARTAHGGTCDNCLNSTGGESRFILHNSALCEACYGAIDVQPCPTEGCNEAVRPGYGACGRCDYRARAVTRPTASVRTLDGYSQHGGNLAQVLNYTHTPEYKLINKPWGKDIYLGVELEIAYPRNRFSEVHKIITDAAPGKWFAKQDASIMDVDSASRSFMSSYAGAELVFTPMSLAAWRDINIHKVFSELVKIGCLSDKTNTCGLHIHTSLANGRISPAISNRARALYTSFGSRRVVKLSRRRTESMRRWARVPSDIRLWSENRYVALNYNRRTLELRHFNGTLNHNSFKAALQFADALIRFCKTSEAKYLESRIVKTNISGDDQAWHKLCQFIASAPDYKILTSYLHSRGILPAQNKKGA